MLRIYSQSSAYQYVKLIDNPYFKDPSGQISRQNDFEKLREMVMTLAPDFFKNSAESYREINKVFPLKNAMSLDPDIVEDFLNRLMEHLEAKKHSSLVSEKDGLIQFPSERVLSQEDLEAKVRQIGEYIVSKNPQLFEKPKDWALRQGLEGKEVPVFLPFNEQLATVRVESIENQGFNFRGDIISVYDPNQNKMVLLTEDMEVFDPSYSMVKSYGGRFPLSAEDVRQAEDLLKNTSAR